MSKAKASGQKKFTPTHTYTYHRTTNKRVMQQERNHNISSLLPIGLGVLYGWEWNFAYFNSEEEEGTPEKPGTKDLNWLHFVYAGITAQLTPRDRLNEHINKKNVLQDGKKNKNLYVGLNNALFNTMPEGIYGERKLTDSMLKEDVFKVVDLVSLFDLGGAESGMISVHKLKNTTNALGVNVLSSIAESGEVKGGGVVGLNQEVGSGAGGEGDPVTQARAPLEWLYAAFYSATEDTGKKHIKIGRTLSKHPDAFSFSGGTPVKDKMLMILHTHAKKEAKVRGAFQNSKVNVNTKQDFEVAIQLFLTYVGANLDQVGFVLDENNNIKVDSKFNKIAGQNRGAEIDAFITAESDAGKGKKRDLGDVGGREIALNELYSQIKKKPKQVSFDIITSVADSLDESELAEIKKEVLKSSAIPKEISHKWIEDEVFNKTNQKIEFGVNMTKFKGVSQDTLKKIYLFLLKVSEKRSKGGVGAVPSNLIGNKINLVSKALGLGQYTKKSGKK